MNIQTPYLLFLGNATDLLSVKIANSIVDWRPELCIGEIGLAGCTISKDLPALSVAEAHAKGARTLVLTVNNSGGYIEPDWIPTILEALDAGLDVASGMHDRLAGIPEVAERAKLRGRQLLDVRHNDQKLRTGNGKKRSGKRLLTVGTDCSGGKMYTALALEKEMQARGMAADFVATGQCGIFVCGSGIAIDCVIADFIAGAAEALTPDNDPEHWDLVEGQGSLSHASFAGVSLGLLHGTQPDALVVCHAEGRTHMRGLPDYPLPGLEETIEMNLSAARLTNPAVQCAGIAVNTSMLSEDDSQAVLQRYRERSGLPCVDPLRTGVKAIVDGLSTV